MSLFITESAALSIFDHIANGSVVADTHGDLYIAKGSLERTPQGLAFVSHVFSYMSANLFFCFGDFPKHEDNDAMTRFEPQGTTTTRTITTGDGQVLPRTIAEGHPKFEGPSCYIYFSRKFLRYFASDFARDTPSNRRAALFQFTLVLLASERSNAQMLLAQRPLIKYPGFLVKGDPSIEGGAVAILYCRINHRVTLLTAESIRRLFLKETWASIQYENGLQTIWHEADRTCLYYHEPSDGGSSADHDDRGHLKVIVDGNITCSLAWDVVRAGHRLCQPSHEPH